jgi:hypothetical protein
MYHPQAVSGFASSTRLSSHPVRWTGVVSAILVALCVCALPSAALAQTTKPTPGVLPPWANPYGRSYSQWSAAQWQWELQQPNVPTSPAVNPNPGTKDQPEAVDCTLGQTGKVWFLAGTTLAQPSSATYRSCTIPTGVSLFFPVIDAWIDNLNCPNLTQGDSTGDQLRQTVQQQTDTIMPKSMTVTIDGRSVQGLTDSSTAYRATVGGFSYTLPGNNWLSPLFCAPPNTPLSAGTMPPPPGAYADGVYIMLTPLSPGVHHISFAGVEFGVPAFGPASENVTYTITVKPR